MADLRAAEYRRFEDIKHTTEDGIEFWYARELSPVLEYTEWRNFSRVIDKAMLACKNSNYALDDHFVEVNKMIEIGKGGKRRTKDYIWWAAGIGYSRQKGTGPRAEDTRPHEQRGVGCKPIPYHANRGQDAPG